MTTPLRRPVIGMTSHPRVVDVASGPTLLHTVSRYYVDAVRKAGGLPVILPVLAPEEAPAILAAVDGVRFTGGGDVAPDQFDEPPHAATAGIDTSRDAFELALAQAVVEAESPALAICRGMQVVNVALGGSLVQHLPDSTALAHDRSDQWRSEVHGLEVAPGSVLASVIGESTTVNSIHHQGVGRMGDGAIAVAWAPDGTIEAFEVGRLVAVQWHPELLVERAASSNLFMNFVQRARQWANDRGSDERDSLRER
ncbi:MAG TPA: gamma-glutamyl-gamma-aminobutyrate hydrolase family protein [Acidimicrobiales bacterium]|nr:gamma-glutamyl-gamma-aminobutyrate hydrolase family protein [Acidimicrobiales bacterium]